MDLKKVEKYCLDNGIKLSRIISPMDRFLLKFKITEAPILFLTLKSQLLITSAYWFFVFPFGLWIIFSFVLLDPFWFKIVFSQPSDFLIGFFCHLIGSLVWGAVITLSGRRAFKKLNFLSLVELEKYD